MDFYEVVGQVLALLQRQGRVSYRALKRQFHIDDAFIEDLKEELCFAHPVVDEGGRGLVWTGSPEGTLASSAPPDPSSQQSTTQEKPSPQVLPLPTAPPPPDAERRQLTVMFIDLVDSTKLSSQLDPEDYRDMVRAYQRVCSEVITRFDGHIAQLLGDGLLVYFGYPQAHEDDAQRAVRTGLGIIEAVGALNTRLEQDKGIGLAIRLGIHTGLVVVGEMGSQGRQEPLALGQVPNVCSRIQGLAAPNTIAMSEATYRLVQGYFVCQDLGAQSLRGVTESMRVYQVLSESGATSRLEVAQPRGLTPLVGRESEVALLLERWEQAKSGQGQVVLLTGDAGIGKSRLVQMLKEHVANEPHVRWECRSSEHSQNTALFPLVELFQRLLRFQAEDTPDEKLAKLEQTLSQYRLPLEETVPWFAPFLALPLPEDRYASLALSPQRPKDARNYCRHPPRTCGTSTCALYPGRPALDGSHNPGMVESADRADTNDLDLDGTDLSSVFPTYLASPLVSYGDHGSSLITHPGRTNCRRYNRWENLPSRCPPANHCQDGWRAIICRGNDQSDSRIRSPQSRR